MWWTVLGCMREESALPESGGIVPLEDRDPAPERFEASVVAGPARIVLADGTVVNGKGYDGLVPGPLIRVPLGARVAVTLENQLSESFHTTIHWHGIEGNNAADGTHTTQDAVRRGERFTYDFTVPRAGFHWYHPHIDGAQLVFEGLYAPLIVDDPDEPELIAAGVLPRDEQILVLSDLSHFQGTPYRVATDGTEVMNGTEGSLLLVNGRQEPTFDISASGPTRLRVVNTSIARFWRLSIPGHTLYRVGGEGGLLDRVRVEGGSVTADVTRLSDGTPLGTTEVELGYDRGEILLGPAERVDLVLQPEGDAGDALELRWEDYARGRHQMYEEDGVVVTEDADDDGTRPGARVARFRLVEDGAPRWTLAEGDPVLGAVGRAVGAVAETNALDWTGPDAMVMSEKMDHVIDAAGNLEMTSEFYMDGQSWIADHHVGALQTEAPTARHARLGDTLSWEIRNETEMDHPLHLHGFSYQPVRFFQDDPEADTRTSWPWGADEYEDTTVVPGHTSLLVRVPLLDPVGDGGGAGRWMRHCHLLQHGENGMMSELIVDE